MKNEIIELTEEMQRLAAQLIATHPARNLCLIGGLRFRLLDGSSRLSVDIDYHWEGDGAGKAEEIVTLLRGKLLPEVKDRLGYGGSVQAASGPEADSPFVATVDLAFYRPDVPGSRIEIPLKISSLPLADPPEVRTVAGTVFLTVSDADMVESKVIALLGRRYVQARDFVDIFLFRSSLVVDSGMRLAEKFSRLGWQAGAAAGRLAKVVSGREHHVRGIDLILDEQVDGTAAGHIRAAGGGALVFDEVVALVRELLPSGEGAP